ncbi:MAG: histidinol-phosphate aminotransferase [Chloroflexota bacterium]|jgi:histidinol-phosphate aminotransferase|nr:histidinol-phosphate aminotransferase [Chloroflexota bacterium]
MSRYRKPSLSAFEPYVPGIQPADGEAWVKLNTNESPFPPAPGVREAVGAAVDRLALYPDPTQREFRETVAQVLDVSPEMVVGGNGADEVLAMAVRAFVPAGGRAAYLEPSYTLVPKLCAINEVMGEEHAFADGYTLPVEFIESNAPLKFLTNPNSPTGTLVPLEAIAELCDASTGVVLLDEAYVDFSPRSGLDILDRHSNLLLVRTMSKSYGLAGLRVGYAVGAADLVADLWAVKDICNLGRLPLAAAVAALRDREYWRGCVDDTILNRRLLSEELTQRGWQVLPSGANFVFAVPPEPAAGVYQRLLDRHVLVRHLARPSVSHGLRISIGTREQCQALLTALKA